MRTLIRIGCISISLALFTLWGEGARSASALAACAPGDTAAAAVPGGAGTRPSLSDFARSAEQADSAKAAADSTAAGGDSLAAGGDSLAARADSAAIDTALAAAQDTLDYFVPVSTFTVRSNDVTISIGSRLNVTINTGKGWTFYQSINMDRTKYRQREMEDITENAVSKAQKLEPGVYKLAMQASESFSKKKTLGLGRFGQDIIYNDTGGGVDFQLLKPLLGATTSDLTVKGDATKGTHDFKYDRSFSGSASGSAKYVLGGVLSVGGGLGASGKREKSYIGGNRFGPMPSNADTVRAVVGYGRNTKKTVEVSYSWVKGIERKVMPPLGNTYEILKDATLAKQEEARNRAEQLSVNTYFAPLPAVSFETKFKHAKANQNYRVDTRLSKESEENSIDATVRYAYASRGSVQFGISTSDDVWDYGPVSLSSYRERQNLLSASLSQRVGDSLKISVNGKTYLKQRFYLKQDVNPRDADYLYSGGELRLNAPFKRFSADVGCLIDRFETINIDNTLSGDNRVDYKYQLGPRLSVKPLWWVSISQDYIVKIEYTDFVYEEDENYLNRTTTLNTRASFNATRAFGFEFLHSYLMKDTGSYLKGDGGEYYVPSNETFEHSLSLTAGYEMFEEFTIKAKNDYRIQRSNVLASRNGVRIISATTVYESGGMRIGFERKKSFGERGGISLDVAYVRNFGPYITPERKEYWQADSELTLRF